MDDIIDELYDEEILLEMGKCFMFINNLHLFLPVILEKHILSILTKYETLSVRITSIKALKLSVPIFSTSSKNSMTLRKLR